MGIFILVILGMVFLQTAVLLSLLRLRLRLPLLAAAAAGIYCCHPWAAGFNYRIFISFIDDADTLGWVCTVAMAQSLAALLLLTGLAKRRTEGRRPAFYMYAALLPPVLLPVGAAAGMIYLFNVGTGREFRLLALAYAGVFFLAVLLGSEVFSRFGRSAENRLEAVAGIYLLTVAATMFLPLTVNTGSPAATHTAIEYGRVFSVLAGMALVTAVAALLHLLRCRRKLNQKWKDAYESGD